ncbi:MAG: CDP-alcohol phosphatidyltransferase family protein [Nitriliruptor sp.]|nr:MAG: CDP-alcohol phosphatidyltransferase family protein [Nitriliruptor sp.]
MALRSRFPAAVDAVTAPLGRGLGRTGVSPNTLTTLGLLLTASAAVLVAVQRFHLAAAVLIVGGMMDVLDGSVARATERSTPFGGFYDSVSDRISDGLILGGIAWAVRDQPRLLALALAALVAAFLTSYVRAKAESIDLDCSVGVLERAERAMLIIVGLLLHPWLFEPVLWLLAVGGTVTVVQRIHHVWCQIDRDVSEELLALALHDRAWSRAFKKAARRFYGERNFDGAVDGLSEQTETAEPAEQSGGRAERHPSPIDVARGDEDPGYAR